MYADEMAKKITEAEWRAWLDKQPPVNPMPPRVAAEVQKILDCASRRMLREKAVTTAVSDQ